MPELTTRQRLGSLWSFQGRARVLHLTWFAFFLTFVVWFNFAPFANTIQAQLGLSDTQIETIGLANVALTVPARVLVGMALDRWGPRRTFAAILMFAFVPCTTFALATSFELLLASRLALSLVGAGFVVGIRMVAEWFPPREVGLAEGVYGGWGNFGSAAAALTLPTVATVVGGPHGWRIAIAITGVIALVYGLCYLRAVSDTPQGRFYAQPQRQGALEVTSPAGVLGLILVHLPMIGVLGVLAWRLQLVGFLSAGVTWAVIAVLAAVFVWQTRRVVQVNRAALARRYEPSDQYPFRSVAILCVVYAVTFGSELAVVSMLPTFFADTFGLSAVVAGAAGSAYAVMNLVSRAAGGLFSDVLGNRRRTLLVLLLALAGGYALLASIGAGWPVVAAVAAVMLCSFFVQAGEGATYAIVPLVKRRVSGQISGMVGAYGNVGALLYLTLLIFAGPSVFFVAIGASAVAAAIACRWLPEPADGFAADHPDVGTATAADAP